MLLVLIPALASALVVERRKRQLAEQQFMAERERAVVERERALAVAREAQAYAELVRAQSDAMARSPRPSGEPSGRTSVEPGR
jgi:hypothetical protein